MFVLTWRSVSWPEYAPSDFGGLFTELKGALKIAEDICKELELPTPCDWGTYNTMGGKMWSIKVVVPDTEPVWTRKSDVVFQINECQPDERLKWSK
jgi:hypothetical protein